MKSTKKKFQADWVLIGVALLAALLNTYGIWWESNSNTYYTAAVTSMLQSFHNFFYASFDPGGFVSVDKPPVALWIQTIFAWIFGVHGWSVVLPGGISVVGTVLLIYALVMPAFGIGAARLASLVMACSPVAAAVAHTNNLDAILVFDLVAAAWLLFKGMREEREALVLGAFALVGLGFNIKMLQAYMVVPAFILFFLLAYQGEWKRKALVLAIAIALLGGVTLSWPLAVDLTPASDRPYVGGSDSNSVLELAFSYNGISRLLGEQATADFGSGGDATPFNFGAAGSRLGVGNPGPLRLFQSELSGQISWLLPLALLGAATLLWGLSSLRVTTNKQQETLFWLAWLLPGIVFFSAASFFHHHYLVMLAPPAAALAGAGGMELWRMYREEKRWQCWLLPAVLVLTVALHTYILWPYANAIGSGVIIGLGLAGVALAGLLIGLQANGKYPAFPITAALALVMAGPLFWSLSPILYGVDSMLPRAGYDSHHIIGNAGSLAAERSSAKQRNSANLPGYSAAEVDARLLSYLVQNNTGEKYLFATNDASIASLYIIETGRAVMAIGGFSGTDPILNEERLEAMVTAGQVKYFMIPAQNGRIYARGNNSWILEWVVAYGTVILPGEWKTDPDNQGVTGTKYSNYPNSLYAVGL